MVEEFLAIVLLGYTLLFTVKQFLSEEKFDKIIYHSKVTKITAQAISLVAIGTIAVSLYFFVSLVVLSFIQSGAFKVVLVNNSWDNRPFLMFLSALGGMGLSVLPLGIVYFLPAFGSKKKTEVLNNAFLS